VGVETLALPVDPARDHIRGAAEPRVTLVEYGDFQCPYCRDAYPVVRELMDQSAGWLRLVFRHMPLDDLHPRAGAAAEAAEAAAAQGAFWEMHDRLFESRGDLSDAALREHAAALGLDLERFDREVGAGVYEPRIEEDYESGARSGIPSTPRFFVNGRIHLGSSAGPDLRRAVEAAF
jgi:protein-disulfide isomerase